MLLYLIAAEPVSWSPKAIALSVLLDGVGVVPFTQSREQKSRVFLQNLSIFSQPFSLVFGYHFTVYFNLSLSLTPNTVALPEAALAVVLLQGEVPLFTALHVKPFGVRHYLQDKSQVLLGAYKILLNRSLISALHSSNCKCLFIP